ncbi:hypothetical protein CsatB_018073 [Cannabis sativa]|uniref:Uncharacterized protein n=1 Tax=Cannabis sativa TaxID=3483 RepID=A0A803QXR0_CANSA
MRAFSTKLFMIFILSGLYLATSAFNPYGNEKSSFHVLTRIDKFRMILAKMEAYDNSMVHSRSLGSRRILPPPPPTKNRQSAMRAPAPPPLVAY